MITRTGRQFPGPAQVIVLLLACWYLFNLAETVRYVAEDYTQIPVADYWRVMELWPNAHAFQWSSLWVQYNEHRLVFPAVVWMADMFLLHGRMYLPVALSGLCYAGVWGVLVWAGYSPRACRAPLREGALLLAGVVLAWKGCSSAVATPFLLCLTMAQFASALALGFLIKAGETGRGGYLAAAIAAGVAATYSVANGMLVWPALLACAALLKVNKRQIGVVAIAAVACVGLFFFRHHLPPNHITENIGHPLGVLEFVCCYMSMPFGGFRAASFGTLVGAANMLAMIGCLILARARNLVGTRLGAMVFGTYLLIVMSALLTALVRMQAGDLEFIPATEWRSVTMPTAGWAVLAMAVIWLGGQSYAGKWAWATVLLTAALAGCGFVKAQAWLAMTREDAQYGQITATMMRNKVFAPEQLRRSSPDAERAAAYSKALRADHKSIWAHGDDKWIGQDVTRLYPDHRPIQGRITSVYPVPGGLELLGWAESDSLTDDHAVLFVDSNDRIVGFGRRPAAGMPWDLTSWDTPYALAFVGFVSLDRPVDRLSVYVRALGGRFVRRMEGTVTVPTFTAVREDGTPMPAVVWQKDDSWTLNGYPIRSGNGQAPAGEVYGSWSGSGGKTGVIRSLPFAEPPGKCLVVPVLHGTDSYGQLVEVRSGASQELIAKLPMLAGRSAWERWRVVIASGVGTLVVRAEDEGSGPNQWVAIGRPERCP